MTKTTPMMEQYNRIKNKFHDEILFFRLGDFYEMFHADAKIASSILGLTLTQRHGYPMCGIPYHAAQNYISRLLKAGKKIAICEQTKLPEKGKGIAEREVTEVITPGTVIDENFLDRSKNNYILAFAKEGETFSLSFIDISTGEFQTTSYSEDSFREISEKEFTRIDPSELLIQESLLEESNDVSRLLDLKSSIVVNRFPDWYFDKKDNYLKLCRFFGTNNLKAFDLEETSDELLTAGTLLSYIEETSKSVTPHIKNVKRYRQGDFLSLDDASLKNLELLQNLNDGSSKFTLYSILNFTKTSMGARKLRQWISSPLINRDDIIKRQNTVSLLYHNQLALSSMQEELAQILDIQRLTARVAMDKAHGKDVASLGYSLEKVLSICRNMAETFPQNTILDIPISTQQTLSTICDAINNALCESPSILLSEGNLIRRGYNKELDDLHELKDHSQNILNEYLAKEKDRTGIQNLKIKHNRIIGYFFEISKSQLDKVPEHFIRRQSLVNGDRFTTNDLVEFETKINSASEKIIEFERDLFIQLRNELKMNISLFNDVSEVIAEADCQASLAFAATRYGYITPTIHDDQRLIIKEGRHPIVEAHLPHGDFIPNDIELNTKNIHFAMITGPNMAGKSTILRQTALIALMAQIGSFVPAVEAEIGIVDKIFCRVGASDNLTRGESTFLVEMNETALILHNSTNKSLIIMDEVGRGTSTIDGLSIAWAVTEHILEKIGARTLFATHYHELTQIEHLAMSNFSMQVKEYKGDVIFLKKFISGPASNSYGIHVANLAGIPKEVVSRAQTIRSTLVKEESDIFSQLNEAKENTKQPELFSAQDVVLQAIQGLDIINTTPMEALQMLDRWKKELKQ